jgi:hypothetical protein
MYKKTIITTFILSIVLTMSSFKNHKPLNEILVENFAVLRFGGNWSSEGDVNAKGILTFKIEHLNSKISGTAEYVLYDDSQKSGLLSVNGYVKNNIAYIRFRNQKGQTIADGSLKKNETGLIFKQTTKSFWLPKIAYVFKW